MGRDSVSGIATSYGLDGPGIESRWRRDFPHLSRAPCTMGTGSFSGVKRPGRGADNPPHLSAELYLYSPFGPQWPVIGRTYTFVGCRHKDHVMKISYGVRDKREVKKACRNNREVGFRSCGLLASYRV